MLTRDRALRGFYERFLPHMNIYHTFFFRVSDFSWEPVLWYRPPTFGVSRPANQADKSSVPGTATPFHSRSNRSALAVSVIMTTDSCLRRRSGEIA